MKQFQFFASFRFRLIVLVLIALLPFILLTLHYGQNQPQLSWLMLGATLLALGLTALWGESFLERPLKRLLKDTRQISQGNLKIRYGPPYDRGEIGDLERSIDEMAQSLERQQKNLTQQERMRALGQMASGIAHDFNNSLTSILGFSEVLLDQPGLLDDREKVKNFLTKINLSAKDAGSIVQRLREFYRERDRNESFLPININSLVEQTVALTEPRWKNQLMAKNIDIRMSLRLEKTSEVQGNEADLREALTNMIFNAVDAMPKGGTVTLSTWEDSSEVVLQVADTGIGMNPDVRQHCFEPFYTTKGEKGTGLGLAMVYGVIQRHNGKIEIASEEGKGTAFTIRLPKGTLTAQTLKAKLPIGQRIKPLHILVVDDEEPVREVISQFLKNDGHDVISVADGKSAIDIFKPGIFDLIISDGALPEISGTKLISLLKKKDRSIPVILLTGYGDYLMATGEHPEGVDLILSKPVTMVNLREAVSNVVLHPH